ncbi:MAG: hypothetical protein PHD81_01530 [Candidatus Nanoarchaeia archaeon]|nr:hypothetical protein [Candidatus Nanoarchaeia archaeon]MDD5587769.1 hypothetical protein [Candidatus Nanoarchaeia archaeon]
MKIIKILKKAAVIGALALAITLPVSVKAQSVFNGLKGPTKFQVDNRINYSTKEIPSGENVDSFTNNLIFKYWDGTNKGTFAFVNLPYKVIKSGEYNSSGIGDISLGIGPRFETKLKENKLGFLTYLGAVLPTGNKNSKPALGTGRTDYKLGLFGTLLSESKKYEADMALDYTLTEGKGVSDEINAGLVLGGKVDDNLRLVAGPIINLKSGGKNDGDYTVNGRINVRYTPSGDIGKKMHFELWYDHLLGYQGKSSVKDGEALTLVGRLNF